MKMGFIVNPIAGMGGKVGLKGTDNVLDIAITKGAEPIAPGRAMQFLLKLKQDIDEIPMEIFTCPDKMGEEEVMASSFPANILPMEVGKVTTAKDTKIAVKLLTAANVDLIVFVGGDGTAKDVFDAIQECTEVPVTGVPSGVKMYSGIFAVNPLDAAEVVIAFARKQAQLKEFEIMDSDENAIRSNTFSVKLHGYLDGPFLPAHSQGSKQASPETVDEKENQRAIARFIIEETPSDATWILGPGTTVKNVAKLLGVKKTILGVDICKEGKVTLDVDEKTILEDVEEWRNTWIVLSPIGRQGILLGRGNQQISPEVLKRIRKRQIIVAATKSKLLSIEGHTLRVDTGNAETNKLLRGYIRVATDYREWRLMPVQ